MGKTADLAMVQKTIIDTLHKEEAHNQLPPPPPRIENVPNCDTTMSIEPNREFCEPLHP